MKAYSAVADVEGLLWGVLVAGSLGHWYTSSGIGLLPDLKASKDGTPNIQKCAFHDQVVSTLPNGSVT
jgi:hypothetical protein